MSCNKTIPESQYLEGIEFRRHCEYFAVSRCGKVVGKLGRILKQKSQGHYRNVSYAHVLGVRHKYVHRMVAQVWVPNPTNAPCVNHIDGNKENNDWTNLEWVTHAANTAHAIATGLHSNCPTRGQRGFQPSTRQNPAHGNAYAYGADAQGAGRDLPAVPPPN